MLVSLCSHLNGWSDTLKLYCVWFPDSRSLYVNNLTGIAVCTPGMLVHARLHILLG